MIVALVIVSLLLYATVFAIHHGDRDRGTDHRAPRVRTWVVRLTAALMAATLAQVALGTQVRGHVDQALDAGAARDMALMAAGRWDAWHRDGAILVVVLTMILVRLRRPLHSGDTIARWIGATFALTVAQVVLGVVMAYAGLPQYAQVLHLTVASLLLGAQTVVLLLAMWE
jgi:cytochrome c oxidase assembly protein subunit 15